MLSAQGRSSTATVLEFPAVSQRFSTVVEAFGDLTNVWGYNKSPP